jgi:arylamine N-acetyltransferase
MAGVVMLIVETRGRLWLTDANFGVAAETTHPTMAETTQNQAQQQKDSRQPRPLQRLRKRTSDCRSCPYSSPMISAIREVTAGNSAVAMCHTMSKLMPK